MTVDRRQNIRRVFRSHGARRARCSRHADHRRPQPQAAARCAQDLGMLRLAHGAQRVGRRRVVTTSGQSLGARQASRHWFHRRWPAALEIATQGLQKISAAIVLVQHVRSNCLLAGIASSCSASGMPVRLAKGETPQISVVLLRQDQPSYSAFEGRRWRTPQNQSTKFLSPQSMCFQA